MSKKIAIVDHMINHGGGSRVLRNLLPAMKKLRPDWTFVLYGNQAAIDRDGLQADLAPFVTIKSLQSVRLANLKSLSRLKGSKTIVSFLQTKFKKHLSLLPLFFSGAIEKEIERIYKNCDLLFCTWPYLVDCPTLSLSKPVVAIFHDFNFRYYFNGAMIHPIHLNSLYEQIPKWLDVSIPILSTHFMQKELETFYPEFASKSRVIHLASLGAQTELSLSEARNIVQSLGIHGPYLLYPTNTSSHKNVGSLLSAFHRLKNKYPDLKLVFAGAGTEWIQGKTERFGLRREAGEQEVMGLGYVSNQTIDALIQCASVVISTSLYEAGCGPGLDAWFHAVPVAMSNIPAFTEHLEVQKVRAHIFDPQSPAEIAEKIDWILTHPEEAKQDALYSQQKMKEYNWNEVAIKYLDVFEKALYEKNSCLSPLSARK